MFNYVRFLNWNINNVHISILNQLLSEIIGITPRFLDYNSSYEQGYLTQIKCHLRISHWFVKIHIQHFLVRSILDLRICFKESTWMQFSFGNGGSLCVRIFQLCLILFHGWFWDYAIWFLPFQRYKSLYPNHEGGFLGNLLLLLSKLLIRRLLAILLLHLFKVESTPTYS